MPVTVTYDNCTDCCGSIIFNICCGSTGIPGTLNFVVTAVANCGGYGTAFPSGNVGQITWSADGPPVFGTGWFGSEPANSGTSVMDCLMACTGSDTFRNSQRNDHCGNGNFDATLIYGLAVNNCIGSACMTLNSCSPFDATASITFNVGVLACLTPPCQVSLHIYA